MKTDHAAHNCFREAELLHDEMKAEGAVRVGFFLFVGDNDSPRQESHYRGNTAFAGSVFEKLAGEVIKNHESAGCARCDAVAAALAGALTMYRRVMAASGTRDC